jgi:hypothetical protein
MITNSELFYFFKDVKNQNSINVYNFIFEWFNTYGIFMKHIEVQS